MGARNFNYILEDDKLVGQNKRGGEFTQKSQNMLK